MSELSPAQIRCIEMMLSGETINEIATKLKISPSLISKWGREEAFKLEMSNTAKTVHDAAMARIVSLNLESIDRLGEIMRESNDKNALSAIKTILETSSKWLDKDFQIRLERLEQQFKTLSDDT